MKQKILELKKLNAAYMAALEWDYCPDTDQLSEVIELIDTGITDKELEDSLSDNCGRRPDEIATSMTEIIKSL